MSLSASIREQLLNSFRAELAEHVQTISDGLLSLEQNRVIGDARRTMLEDIFRASHSLKGAARAVGVTAVEQLAHAMESVLNALQNETIEPSQDLFNACYRALDAIQLVQGAFDAGETVPPVEVLNALSGLAPFRPGPSLKSLEEIKLAPPENRKEAQASATAQVGSRTSSRISASSIPPSQTPTSPVLDQKLVKEEIKKQLFPEPSPAPISAQPDTKSSHFTPSTEPPMKLPQLTEDRSTKVESKGQNLPNMPEPTTDLSGYNAEGPEPPIPAPLSGLGSKTGDGTIRVSVSKLDALMAQLSELLVVKLHTEQRLSQVKKIQDQVSLSQKEWSQVRNSYNRLMRQDLSGYLSPTDVMYAGMLSHRTGRLSKMGTNQERLEKDTLQLLRYATAVQEQMRDLSAMVNTLSYEFSSDAMQMSLVIDELELEIKRARMLPLMTIMGSFQRMIRDLAQEAGKEVLLELVGIDTELDKHVLEQIKDPLIHLLRNAVDHGIEIPQKRIAAGKSPQGSITLSAEQHGQEVVITVSDDGAGLNLASIRKAIARQGKVDADALNDTEVAESIFNIGISTSPIITDISGRGVGLDVVRRNMDALHGRIDIQWKPNLGTTFILTLPLTLTSSRGLLVRASNEIFAIPHSSVERILNIRPQDIFSLEGQDTMYYGGTPITVIRLSDILELPRSSNEYDSTHIPVVIVSAADRRMAFAVDELVGEQEVVIKNLGKQLSRVGGIAGASVMGDGSVILILNVSDLLKLAIHGGRRSIFDVFTKAEEEAVARSQQRILIVDDSITTRTLEKNILESAGYVVQLATDGQEALELILSTSLPDLIVSDIAMPRMNGFELTKRLKAEEKTMKVPVILVTSLDSPEDKAHGIDVGADAYIIKSQFDQKNLLETIEQLI